MSYYRDMQMIRVVMFLIIVGVVGGGYWLYSQGKLPTAITSKVPFLTNQGSVAENGGSSESAGSQVASLDSIKNSISGVKIPQLPDNTTEQLGTVKDRATEVGSTVGNVLGTAVQQASSSGSLQEKAFDYGRYLYCQQVVKDYETRTKTQ